MVIITALCITLVFLLPVAVIALLIARSNAGRPAAPPLPPVAPQWAQDPTGRHEFRYWDGTRWTAQVANAGVAVTEFGGAYPSASNAPQEVPSNGAARSVGPGS
jgi:hypothetical protein